MKYSEIINEVRELYPSEYDDSQFKKWIQELCDTCTEFTEAERVEIRSLEDECIAPPPHDRMFIDFVMAQVALHQHDDESYSRYIGMFNSRYEKYRRWYIKSGGGKTYRFENWI